MYVLSIIEQLKFGRIHALYEDLMATLDVSNEDERALLYFLAEYGKVLEYYDRKRDGKERKDASRLERRLHKRISDFRLKFNPMGPDQRDLNDTLRKMQSGLLEHIRQA